MDEGQIDSMLADRMRAKSKRDYASADTLLADLKAIGGASSQAMERATRPCICEVDTTAHS